MAEALKSFEMASSNGAPLAGLVVQLYTASDLQPNPGTVLGTTVTDANGMWQFVGLPVGLYDVKVIAPGINQVKWYKGNVKVGVAEVYGVTNDTSRPGRNRAINGRFSVNERLVVAQTNNAYWIDCWRTLVELANGVTWVRDTGDVPVGAKYAARGNIGAVLNSKFGLFHVLDDRTALDVVANNGCLSLKIKASVGISNVKAALIGFNGTPNATTGSPINTWNADGVTPTLASGWGFLHAANTLPVTGAWQRIVVAENVVIPSNYVNLGVFIWRDNKSNATTTEAIQITDIQVESGPYATPIEQRSWEHEALLALARHADVGPGNSAIFAAWDVNGAARTLTIRIPTPVPMRVQPSVGVVGSWAIGNVTAQPVVSAADRFGAAVSVYSTGAGYSFFNTVDNTTYLRFDAEV